MTKTATGTPDPLSRAEVVAFLIASHAISVGKPFPERVRGPYDSAMSKTNGELECLDWARTYVPALLGRPLTDEDTALGLIRELRGL